MATRFAADTPGYGSGWKAYHHGERYSERDLVQLINSGEYGGAGFAAGYRAAAGGVGLYDEMFGSV